MLPQRLIGTQAFLPAILTHIRNAASPVSLPLDRVIFQSILLCLIAQDKHLIIRTPEEDVGLAVQLTVWMLSSVFNLEAHKVKLRNGRKQVARPPRSSTPTSNRQTKSSTATNYPDTMVQVVDAFLRSLFLHSSEMSTSALTSLDEELPQGKHSTGHSRQTSSTNNLAAASQSLETASTVLFDPTNRKLDLNIASGSSAITLPSILKPQPIYPGHTSFSQSPSLRISHANTDPFPSSRKRKARSQAYGEDAQIPKHLPQALIISGLENANIAVQRSLATVLSEKKVVLNDQKGQNGEWALPDGFICVYVCPWNAKERPPVHKTLLDQFAMSTNVFIPQNIRTDFRLLPFTVSALLEPHHSDVSYSNPGSPSAPIHVQLPPTHTPPIHTKPLPGHGHHPQSHYQLQRSSSQHGFTPIPHALAYAPFSPPISQPPLRPSTTLRLPPLLPPKFLVALRTAYYQTHVAYTLDSYLLDLITATRHDSKLDGTLLTAKSMKDARDLVKASRVVATDLTGMELVRPGSLNKDEEDQEKISHNEGDEEEEFHSTHSNPEALSDSMAMPVLEVSEVDIARIFPRVVSHRVRLRDGLEDEVLASALYGATFKPPPSLIPEGEKTFDSVKSVLVSILSEV